MVFSIHILNYFIFFVVWLAVERKMWRLQESVHKYASNISKPNGQKTVHLYDTVSVL